MVSSLLMTYTCAGSAEGDALCATLYTGGCGEWPHFREFRKFFSFLLWSTAHGQESAFVPLPCVLVLPGTFHTRLNLRSQLEVDEVQASQR